MADDDLKRQARRRRILENLNTRLEKITGKCTENRTEDKLNELNYSSLEIENSSIITENIFKKKGGESLTEKKTDVLVQDNSNIQDFEFTTQLQQSENQSVLSHLNYEYFFQENSNHFKNLSCRSKITLVNQIIYEKSKHLFSSLFFKSLSYIFLAALMNILFILNVDFSLYKGIIIPYLVMSLTHLCLGKKLNEFQSSSIFIATLILCNVKPGIVHNLKRLLILCSITLKDFALYLTSLLLFNWIISMWCTNLNYIQFF